MSDRLAVIYAGKIVESGPTALVTSAPSQARHTRAPCWTRFRRRRPSERSRVEDGGCRAEPLGAVRTAVSAPRSPRAPDAALAEVRSWWRHDR